MRRGHAAVLLIVLAGFAGVAPAHPLAPALLEVRETAPEHYALLWRTSTLRAQVQDVAPRLPASCADTAAPSVDVAGTALSLRWTAHCPGGLAGQVVRFEGLERSVINVIVRLERGQGAPVEVLLDARRAAYTVPAPAAAVAPFTRYFTLGVEHLLGGLDHVLFVGGLLLLVHGWRRLLLTVTAFTLGHSVTLALATLGYARVDSALAELGIALSLLLLAWELSRARNAPGLPERRDRPGLPLMAGAFGLLHGLGFAGALAELGLPPGAVAPALLGFNLGIEAGQLGVITLLVLGKRAVDAVHWPGRWRADGAPVHAVAVYAIGTLAAWWCFQRAEVFFT